MHLLFKPGKLRMLSLGFAIFILMAMGTGVLAVKYLTNAKLTQYPRIARISPGAYADFDIVVTNAADVDIDGLSLDSGSQWLLFDRGEFSVEANRTRTMAAKISIPESTGPGPYSVNISLVVSPGVLDTETFPVIVLNESGSASIATIDLEVMRYGIELLEGKINVFGGGGKNDELAGIYTLTNNAKESFSRGEYVLAGDNILLANRAIDELMLKKEKEKIYVIAFILAAAIIAASAFLYAWMKTSGTQISGIFK